MKIYVITRGAYSAYRIVCATTDKATAERLERLYSDAYEPASIEEFEDKEFNKGLAVYECIYFATSDGYSAEPCDDIGDIGKLEYQGYFNQYILRTYAKDEKQAIKIMQDKMAEYKAKKEGLI